VKNKKYLPLDHISDQEFAFVIEDPISPTYNPGYTVLRQSNEFSIIIYECQKAYQALCMRETALFTVPFKN
jgi:hypothetical protein